MTHMTISSRERITGGRVWDRQRDRGNTSSRSRRTYATGGPRRRPSSCLRLFHAAPRAECGCDCRTARCVLGLSNGWYRVMSTLDFNREHKKRRSSVDPTMLRELTSCRCQLSLRFLKAAGEGPLRFFYTTQTLCRYKHGDRWIRTDGQRGQWMHCRVSKPSELMKLTTRATQTLDIRWTL